MRAARSRLLLSVKSEPPVAAAMAAKASGGSEDAKSTQSQNLEYCTATTRQCMTTFMFCLSM